jgi:hypothetical protein
MFPMRMIDTIRDKCIEEMEEQYMARLELLVNEEQYDDARSIVSEMSIEGLDDDERTWDFIDDLTDFTDQDIPHIVWGEID